MTRGKKLGALLLVLVLLIAAVWAVKGDDDNVAEPSAEQTPLVTEFPKVVTSIRWHYGDRVLAFELVDGKWTYPIDKAFPVSEGVISHLLSVLNGLTVEKAISPVSDLADYGLDTPVCTVVLNDTVCISFGDINALGDARYVTLDGSTVYLTDKSAVSNFAVDLYDMLKTETIPYIYTVTDITVERGGEDLVLRAEPAGNARVWYGKDGEEELALDKELAEDFADTVTGIYWGDCVAYEADSKDLKAYGLQNPRAVLTVDYTESEQVATELTDKHGQTIYDTVTHAYSFVLELGNDAEGGVYARLPGSSMVYVIADAFAQEILQCTVEDLLPAEAA